MFGLIKKDKKIEELLKVLEMDASNNYKDAAQTDLARVEAEIAAAAENGRIKGKQKEHYEKALREWKGQLKEFTHKDQLKNYTRR